MQSTILNHPDWEINIKAIWTEVGGPPLPALFFRKSSTLFYFSMLLYTQWSACVVLSYFLYLPTGNTFLICPCHSFWMRYLSNGLEGISSNLAQTSKCNGNFKGQCYCDLSKHILGQNSRIHMPIMTTFEVRRQTFCEVVILVLICWEGGH